MGVFCIYSSPLSVWGVCYHDTHPVCPAGEQMGGRAQSCPQSVQRVFESRNALASSASDGILLGKGLLHLVCTW